MQERWHFDRLAMGQRCRCVGHDHTAQCWSADDPRDSQLRILAGKARVRAHNGACTEGYLSMEGSLTSSRDVHLAS
jgi:hypothetical protein